MSDTPETDKQAVGVIGWYSCATVPADFARGLERGRNEAREAFAIATNNCVDAQQQLREMQDQRDFAMSEMERRGCERDKARDTVLRLRKQRAIARNFGEQMKRERDKAILELGAIQATIAEAFNLPRTPLTAADVHAALNHLTQ